LSESCLCYSNDKICLVVFQTLMILVLHYFQYNDNNTRNIAPKPTKTYSYNPQQNIDNSNKNNTSSSD